MKTGETLKGLVKDNRPLEKYPATSPLLALQTILANIWERNQLQHQHFVNAVAFSPDGKEILTASWDKTARLWDLRGRQIAEIEGDYGAISPDWRTIALGNGFTVVLKPVDRNLDELLAHGCDWLKDYFASHPDELQKLPVCQK